MRVQASHGGGFLAAQTLGACASGAAALGLRSGGARASPHVDLPGLGIQLTAPVLAGGFLPTATREFPSLSQLSCFMLFCELPMKQRLQKVFQQKY